MNLNLNKKRKTPPLLGRGPIDPVVRKRIISPIGGAKVKGVYSGLVEMEEKQILSYGITRDELYDRIKHLNQYSLDYSSTSPYWAHRAKKTK